MKINIEAGVEQLLVSASLALKWHARAMELKSSDSEADYVRMLDFSRKEGYYYMRESLALAAFGIFGDAENKILECVNAVEYGTARLYSTKWEKVLEEIKTLLTKTIKEVVDESAKSNTGSVEP